MTSLTERYVAAVLRGLPEGKRADVERELRSSIADAVEDRMAGGDDPVTAETAVLESLGDPSRLATSYSGRPLYLIGPDLFPAYRHILVRLESVTVPIVALVLAGLAVAGGGGYVDAMVRGIGGAFSVGVQLAFWVTVVFAAIERYEIMRDARTEIASATGSWSVDMLPADPGDRVGVGETVGEVLTTLLSIGGILLLRDASWFSSSGADGAPILDPALSAFWLPVLIGVLVTLAVLRVVVHLNGRWTVGLAGGHALLQLAFAAPTVALALSGRLVNPAFMDALGSPDLLDGDGIVMIGLAAGVSLVSAWEIIDAFRRARRTSAAAPAGDGWRERAA